MECVLQRQTVLRLKSFFHKKSKFLQDVLLVFSKFISSVAITTSQKLWLLVIGVLIALFGLMNKGRDKTSVLVLIVGGAFIAGWWFTRKIGAFIYSMSGRNEIFLEASAWNRQAVINFIYEVQETM